VPGPVPPPVAELLRELAADERATAEDLAALAEVVGDPALRAALERHRAISIDQAERAEARLAALGLEPSLVKGLGASIGAAVTGMMELAHGEDPARAARDAVARAQRERATYRALEELAMAAGDHETAALARRGAQEELELANAVDDSWARVARLTLEARAGS
jgi:ferritin-like metal-binding protein YciE